MLKIIFFKLSYTDKYSFVNNSFIHQHQMKLIFFLWNTSIYHICWRVKSKGFICYCNFVRNKKNKYFFFVFHIWMLIRNEYKKWWHYKTKNKHISNKYSKVIVINTMHIDYTLDSDTSPMRHNVFAFAILPKLA